MPTTPTTLPIDAILADPQTAPLLPVTTAADAADYYAAFVAAANAHPDEAPQLARYVRRHPTHVAAAWSAVLFNRHGDVSIEAITALLAASDVLEVRSAVQFFSSAVDAVSSTVDVRRAYDIVKPVRSRPLQQRLLKRIQRTLGTAGTPRNAVPMEAALDIAAQDDRAGREALVRAQDITATERLDAALREARQVRNAARRGGHAKSNRRKRGKRFL